MKLGIALASFVLAAPALARADQATEISIERSEPAPEPPPDPPPKAEPPPAARAPAGRFSIGAGYNPDDGFLARAEVAHDDLFRTGQRLALSADLSTIRQRFALVHEAPGLAGGALDLTTELFADRRAYPDFAREGTGGAVTLGRRLSRTTRVYARYRVEHVAIDPAAAMPEAAGRAMPMPEAARHGEGLLVTLGAGIAYSTLDAPLLPRRGSRLELFAERADRRLGSEHELVRARAVAEHARPLGPFTLRLHGSATAVRSNDPMGVPLAFRLQHEGHADVRGYPLGAGGAAGAAGGNLEALGRIELELPIVPKWGLSIAGFADAGLRYNDDAAWGPRGALLQRSVGVSIIWRSPIGPLRFDWALPLDGERRGAQFLFGFGAP